MDCSRGDWISIQFSLHSVSVQSPWLYGLSNFLSCICLSWLHYELVIILIGTDCTWNFILKCNISGCAMVVILCHYLWSLNRDYSIRCGCKDCWKFILFLLFYKNGITHFDFTRLCVSMFIFPFLFSFSWLSFASRCRLVTLALQGNAGSLPRISRLYRSSAGGTFIVEWGVVR